MNEINEKLDNILLLLTEITSDLRQTKQDASKMSQHVDTVDEYVRIFDSKFKFRRVKGQISNGLVELENSLD